jgi:hypothetical protein
MTTSLARHPPFTLTPEMKRLTNLLVRDMRARTDTIDTFIEVNREFPGLSFHDFHRIAILAAALTMEPEGNG